MDVKDLPAHPEMHQFESLVEDFVKTYSAGDPQALQRIARYYILEGPLTLEQLRSDFSRAVPFTFDASVLRSTARLKSVL